MANSMAKSPAELLAPDRPLTLASVADGAEGLVVSDLARAVAANELEANYVLRVLRHQLRVMNVNTALKPGSTAWVVV